MGYFPFVIHADSLSAISTISISVPPNPPFFSVFKLITLADLIGGTVWHKSIDDGVQAFTGNTHTHKYDSTRRVSNASATIPLCPRVKHVSYCQSYRIWVETSKAKRTSLVTVILQHLHTVTHKHTFAFPFLALMPPPSNVLTVGVRSAGAQNNDTSS